MKFGVSYNTGAYGVVDPDGMLAVARHAEDCGFESFYVPEHVALYPDASLYGHAFPAGLPIADPLECLATRGRRDDEALDALRLLWAGDEKGVSFGGEFYSFTAACSFPKPARPLPVHVGGSSPAAARPPSRSPAGARST